MAKTETETAFATLKAVETKSFEQQLADRRSAIEAACPGADEAFVASQVAAGSSPEQAAKAFIKKLQDDKAKAEAETEEARSAAKKDASGVDPLSNGDEDADGDGDAAESFRDLVQSYVDKGHARDKAVRMAAQKNPALREQAIAQANAR